MLRSPPPASTTEPPHAGADIRFGSLTSGLQALLDFEEDELEAALHQQQQQLMLQQQGQQGQQGPPSQDGAAGAGAGGGGGAAVADQPSGNALAGGWGPVGALLA